MLALPFTEPAREGPVVAMLADGVYDAHALSDVRGSDFVQTGFSDK